MSELKILHKKNLIIKNLIIKLESGITFLNKIYLNRIGKIGYGNTFVNDICTFSQAFIGSNFFCKSILKR